MLESFFQHLEAANHLPDLLVVQLRRFTYSLTVQAYADETVRLKVKLVTKFVQWLKRKRLVVADLHERLVEAFLKHRHRERRGDLRTLLQFLDHLRRQNVVPARNLPCDRSPLARILNNLRTERGLVAHTILEYLSFVRTFLLQRFHGRPLLLKAMKASDISDFVLQYTRGMNVKRAQVMTTAFRSVRLAPVITANRVGFNEIAPQRIELFQPQCSRQSRTIHGKGISSSCSQLLCF